MADETMSPQTGGAGQQDQESSGGPGHGATMGEETLAESTPATGDVEEAAELKDRLLRALAEVENIRRRAARDVEEARKYAVTGFARGLLEVADNLARALQTVPADARGRDQFLDNLVAGVEMTERTLQTLFERHEIRKVQPEKGERFDHNRHQAMFELPSAALPTGTIAEVLQPGYVIADRLLRPAMVGVAKAAPQAGTDDEANGGRS